MKSFNELVCEQNCRLAKLGLVILTEGNVSQISPDRTHFIIKPSGVPYEDLTPLSMVKVMMDGSVPKRSLSPSSDAPTHLELYRRFPEVWGIAHTHSLHATLFAQAGMRIPCFGTTHADAFWGDVPVTRMLTDDEIRHDYELNTGKAIAEVLKPYVKAVLVNRHGPFTIGNSAEEAVNNALILEKVATLAYLGGANVKASTGDIASEILFRKHFGRKHGQLASYGQR